MTECALRSKFMAEAAAWLGTVEGGGRHQQLLDTYNGHKPLARGYALKKTDAWCAGFVSALAVRHGLTDIIPTEVSCSKMIELAKVMGIWQEADDYTPQMGDILIYDWEDSGAGDCTGAPNHVGYVWSVADGYITVLEGNMSRSGCPDHVGIRPVPLNGRYIRGFITPDYAAAAEKREEESNLNYRTLSDIPGYAKATIEKLVASGALLGKGGDEGLDLSEEMVRVLVILDRLGRL